MNTETETITEKEDDYKTITHHPRPTTYDPRPAIDSGHLATPHPPFTIHHAPPATKDQCTLFVWTDITPCSPENFYTCVTIICDSFSVVCFSSHQFLTVSHCRFAHLQVVSPAAHLVFPLTSLLQQSISFVFIFRFIFHTSRLCMFHCYTSDTRGAFTVGKQGGCLQRHHVQRTSPWNRCTSTSGVPIATGSLQRALQSVPVDSSIRNQASTPFLPFSLEPLSLTAAWMSRGRGCAVAIQFELQHSLLRLDPPIAHHGINLMT